MFAEDVWPDVYPPGISRGPGQVSWHHFRVREVSWHHFRVPILLAVGEDLLKKTLRVSPAYSFRARPVINKSLRDFFFFFHFLEWPDVC